MTIQTHPNAARIVRDFEAWGEAADRGEVRPPRDMERERSEIALRLNGPKRPGHVDADDANHLPLFVAANEPQLF